MELSEYEYTKSVCMYSPSISLVKQGFVLIKVANMTLRNLPAQ